MRDLDTPELIHTKSDSIKTTTNTVCMVVEVTIEHKGTLHSSAYHDRASVECMILTCLN